MQSPPGLHGHLDILCEADECGISALARQSFRAPIHIGKPWLDNDTLILNIVNVTAGLLSGDTIHSRIEVASGGRLAVTTPSASRAHHTPTGRIVLEQVFSVAPGGWLEFYPEIFIPQAGTKCRQDTTIRLHAESSLLFIDTIAPGRVARGEVFVFTELDWRTDILLDGLQIVRERYRLAPHLPNLMALKKRFPTGYLGTIYLSGPAWANGEKEWPTLSDLHSDTLWIGCSRLAASTWVIKLIATDSITLRNTVCKIREFLYERTGQKVPLLRKL